MNKISACIILKNEAAFLEEWIIYHVMIGFDHFYIYDNNSTDDLLPILKKYKSIITYIKWPLNDWQQKLAYKHYVENYRNESIWTAFIDVDEFVVYKKRGTLINYLNKNKVDCFWVPWVIFGTNGHITKPQGLVLENYLMKHSIAPKPQCKSIIKNQKINENDLGSPHRISFYENSVYMSTRDSILCINHYMLKSEEDLHEKLSKGSVWNHGLAKTRRSNIAAGKRSLITAYNSTDTRDEYMLKYVSKINRICKMNGNSLYLWILINNWKLSLISFVQYCLLGLEAIFIKINGFIRLSN